MSDTFTPFLIRFFDKDDAVIGGGFLVPNRRVMTCAHVVADALGIDRFTTETPEGEISIDFPFPSPSKKLTARVIHWIPMSSVDGEQPSADEDIAILEILGDIAPGYKPAPISKLANIPKTPFSGHGFPQNRSTPITGLTSDTIAGGCVVIESDRSFGYFVEAGFSGTPVLNQDAIIGMIVRADKPELRAAYMIPSSLLTNVLEKQGLTAQITEVSDPETEEQEQSDLVSHPFLEAFHSLTVPQQKRCKELAIFPEGVNIPLGTLNKLWGNTGSLNDPELRKLWGNTESLSDEEVVALCENLSNLGLLHYGYHFIRLRPTFRQLLIERDKDDHLPSLSTTRQKFLYAHRQSGQSWSDIPESDLYCWKYLAYHLKEADRQDDLIEIISDWSYITSNCSRVS